jgi:hypothetical protein
VIDDQAPPILMATLKAGVITGLLTSVPLLGGLLLLACCSPIIGCGFLGSFWYSKECRRAGSPFTPAMGATVGLVAGAVWAAVVTFFIVATWPGIDAATDGAAMMWEQFDVATPENLDALDQIRAFCHDTSAVMLVFLVFFMYLLVAAVFSTIGGLIGGAVFRNRPYADT